MAILMTELCEKGVDLIWKQCDETQFSKGMEYLEEAMRAGDPEALFFLGYCFSWGDGATGFNDQKAYECYKEGARSGSYRCVPGALRAGRFDDVMRKEARFTEQESYEAVLDAAKQGDAFAAWQIGAALEWEEPVIFTLWPDMRIKDCLYWYEKAAEGGVVNAMVKAGKCYMEGRYTEQDTEKGNYYANNAASLGHAWGLYRMGIYYQEKGNDEAAFDYFAAASSQGDKNAPYCLGCMYLTGRGTDKDIKRAIEELEVAADRENKQCLLELGDIFYRDELVERDNERAFFWYSRAYSVGESRAALPLGHLYLSAWDKQDYQKAAKLFIESAKTEEDGSAFLALGNMSRYGIGQEPDLELALHLYELGAERGNAECMEILGNLYFQGEEVEEDHGKAFHWLETCRQNGTLQSYDILGYLYLKGDGCEADVELAKELLLIAVEDECDGFASYALGYLYEQQEESAEDLDMAAAYYQYAIDLGNESAARRFSHFKKNLFGKWKIVY